jgi:hypothetical protein
MTTLAPQSDDDMLSDGESPPANVDGDRPEGMGGSLADRMRQRADGILRSCAPHARTRVRAAAAFVLALSFLPCIPTIAHAQRLENGKAVFAALDKVTARISRLEIKLGETVKFGALKVTPRACYSRPPTEPPKTSTFVEIDELLLDGKEKRIFAGWMFAESPGLNAVEHPVFDVWLAECAEPPSTSPSQSAAPRARGDAATGASDADLPQRRTRPRR